MTFRAGMIVRKNNERVRYKMVYYKIVQRSKNGNPCKVRERIGDGLFGEIKALTREELHMLKPIIV